MTAEPLVSAPPSQRRSQRPPLRPEHPDRPGCTAVTGADAPCALLAPEESGYQYAGLQRYQGMAAHKVAEAYIYNPAGAALGIILTVSGQDLAAGITAAQAIAEGRKALASLVKERQGEASGLTENRSDLYTWNGLYVRGVL